MAKQNKPRPQASNDHRYWGARPMPKTKAEFFNAITTPTATGTGTVATIRMYGPIDSWGGFWGISTKDVGQVLDALPDSVDQIILRINSPGGEVFEGISILNMLRAHKASVLAVVDGLAASAASVIAAGADETVMSPGTTMMIHSPWSFAMGNSTDMRKSADVLDGLQTSLVEIYQSKAGEQDWDELLADETWLNASQTVDMGLADRVAIVPDAGETETVSDDDDNVTVLFPDDDGDADDVAARSIRVVARQRPMTVALTADTSAYAAGVRATSDNPTHPEPGTEPDDPANNPKEDAVGDSKATEAPAAIAEPQAFNMADLTSAIKDALKEQPVAAVIPAVPSSLAVAKADEPKGPSFAEAMNIFAARKTGTAPAEASHRVESTLTNGSEVFASLTNVGLNVNGNTGGLVNTVPPQWIGELVARVPYSGLWDLVAHDDLTSPNITAFTMTTVPTGGTKGDNGAAVVSTGAKWGPVNTPALRWAGADSFDRTIFDFGLSATAMSSYFRAQLFNYYQWRDSALITAMTAGLTAVAAEAAPTGSAITTIVNQIIDGVVNVEVKGGGVANLAVVTASEFKSLAKNSREQAPAFLTLDLGALTQGDLAGKLTVRPDPTGTLATGDVLVANGAGVTGYELPGSPVRAEQVQVSIGNIDVGLFGYAAAIAASTNFFSLVAAPAS